MQWPRHRDDLVAEQVRLAALAPPTWRPAGIPLVGACYTCFDQRGTRAWAGAALSRGNRHLHAIAIAGDAPVPYQASFLALREGPLLEDALKALGQRPDVVLVNAAGRDHPRRAGLATHLGALLDLPTVGITDRPLIARGQIPSDAYRWASSPLWLDDEVVGAWLRTRAGRRPVAVSVGWRTELTVALAVVRSATRRARTPEPLRRARRAAREARARARGEGERRASP